MKLKDRVAVVTGAASGIGRAIATLFAAEGAKVVAADLNQAGLESLVADVQTNGRTITPFIANVSIRGDVEQLINLTLKLHDRLDVLCNNAGVMDSLTSIVNLNDELWRRVFSVNLDGAMYAVGEQFPLCLLKGVGSLSMLPRSVDCGEA